jgi:hypothetical protein
MSQQIGSNHSPTRDILRVVGVAVLIVGLILTAIGLRSFFSSFATFEPPRYFWCVFIGLPLIAVGGTICKIAYMGAVSRFVANEVAPVGKDLLNYMADGTRDSVREVAAAVGDGLRGSTLPNDRPRTVCDRCDTDNEGSGNFCKNCGAPLAIPKTCLGCGELNDSDARYCNHCGKAIV